MADDTSMSWDEAETIAREMVSQLQAANKIHEACIKARHIDEALRKFESDLAGYTRQLEEAQRQVVIATGAAEKAEADAAARVAAANSHATAAEETATEMVEAHKARIAEVQASLTEVQKQHRTVTAQMQQQVAAKYAPLEAEYAVRINQLRAEETAAKTRRDQALAALRAVAESISVG